MLFRCVNNPSHTYGSNSGDGFCSRPECRGVGYLIREDSVLPGAAISGSFAPPKPRKTPAKKQSSPRVSTTRNSYLSKAKTSVPSYASSTQSASVSSVAATAASVKASKRWAISSFVFGLISLFCTGLLTAPVAIGLGISALIRIKGEPTRHAGKGFAWSGLATGTLALLISATWLIPLLSNAIKSQSSSTQKPVTYSNPPTTVPPQPPPADAVVTIGWLRQSTSTYGPADNQFEVRILNGLVTNTRITMQIRETSVDYQGAWSAWHAVLGETYITDNFGNTYRCDATHSGGSNDGGVQVGGYREGTLIFYGSFPENLSQLTLHFGYYPGRSPISVTSVIVKDPNQTREESAQERRQLKRNITVNTETGYQGNKEQFEIRVVNGFIYPDRVALRIRETSLNCECPWFPWREVVNASYITDDAGNKYSADLSHSVGWTDGNVSSGGYREGTIVFWGNLPQNVSSITLTFAWIRSNPVTMNIPVQ